MGNSKIFLETKSRGRVRFRIESLYRSDGLADWVQFGMSQKKGIVQVQANTLTGSVVIRFEPKQVDVEGLKRNLSELLRKVPKGKKLSRQFIRKTILSQGQGKSWHSIPVNDVVHSMKTSAQAGLTQARVKDQRNQYGQNILPNSANRSSFEILEHQFENLPTLLLSGSAFVSLITGGALDAGVILVVVLINAYIGYSMEIAAEKTIQALVSSEQVRVQVIRGGKYVKIDSTDLVVGDLLSLNPGMSIPADGRLLKVDRLSVDESTMTGESLSVYKEVIDLHDPQVPLADRKNMVYRGTTVTGGNGLVLIVAVGANTEIGKIQRLMTESTQPQTPLEKQLNRLGNQMTGIACVASFAIFIIGMMRGARTFDVLKTGISMAVAAIPEALPTVATTTLARGIKNLETNHILVRHLEAMETLASVDVVCLDKTGTLTMNDMEVVSIVTPRGVFDFTLDGLVFDHQPFDVNKSPTLQKLIQVAALCNEATVSKKNGNNGSSTETALITMAMKLGKSPRDLKQRYPLISTRYRSESQHYMTTVHQDEESKSKKFYAVKGAPAQVVALCGMYRKKNKIFPMTEEMSHSILSENEKLAQAGLRVLGFAYGTSAKDLIWVGLVAMRDPIRVGIKELVPQFHEAGIETIMITGDQAATARAIGNSVGIKKTYARVTPSKKLKIVKSLQKSGKVVAMIGDGVNDGPALKAADVGIVMAAQGSEVTSQVADIVLPTNNIIGLVSAIQEGRTIHQDIKKAVDYIIAQNMSEIIFTFVSVLMGHGKPFSPAQFLWVNLVTDIFPELALAQEPPEKNVLRLPPGDFQRGILVSKDIEKIIFDSLILSTAPLGAYLYFHHRHQSEQKAKSMAFITMTASSLFYTLSARSENVTIFDRKRLARNNYVPMAIGAGFSAEYLAAVTPTLQKLLEIQDLTKADFLLSTLGSLFPFFATELVKLLRRPRGTQTPAMSA